jgi:mannose-6-phosphate isomerase-like protein (cupin superfamily)
MGWTLVNLRETEDQAAAHGFSDTQEARFPRGDLDATQTGLAHIVVKPGRRQPFAHRHRDAEEIYVVLSGSGVLKLDEETVEIGPLDAVRMDPGLARGLEAGPDGLEVLAFGPHREGDAEIVDDLWEDPEGESR